MVTPLQWILLLLGAILSAGYAVWWYRTHEEPVTGRFWAAGLRAAALFLAIAILINPGWSFGLDSGDRAEVALLDASYSMARPEGAGRNSLWATAMDSAAGFPVVWLFGTEVPRRAPTESIPPEPLFDNSRLAPAIRAAGAAGARQVVVFTDGRLTDGMEAAEAARRLGLGVRVVRLGAAYPQIGIARIEKPGWAQQGDSVRIEVELVAVDVTDDSVGVEVVDEAGRVVARANARPPDRDRFASVGLGFLVEGAPGIRRYEVRLAGSAGDPEVRDDVRPFYLRVADRPAAPVLISLQPDWEPPFLTPNLDRLTEVPALVFLQVGDGLVSVREDYRRVEVAEVVRRAANARLLVVHGYGADAPGWVDRLVRDAARLLLLPAGSRGFEVAGWEIELGPPLPGEWYASEEIPASPLALELGGVELDGLPPLRHQLNVEGPAAWVPLRLQRARRGATSPAVVAGTTGERRWAVAAAQGFWRWAFRPGAGHDLYRSLWTGLAGWLIEGRGETGYIAEPLARAVQRGGPLRWPVPEGIDSLALTVESESGDTVWAGSSVGGDTLEVRLGPGRYRYAARIFGGDEEVGSTVGPVEVEWFAEELLPGDGAVTVDLARVEPDVEASSPESTRGLATLAWPYLLLIGLLCVEWTLRRFIGLR